MAEPKTEPQTLDELAAEGDAMEAEGLALLDELDALRRALDTATDEQREVSAALLEGVELTMKELSSVFAKHGMKAISPKIGDKFDPAIHQAMFNAPVPGTKSGELIQVMTEGFFLHDRLLRPAQVGVSSMPAN
jgi:molecular chaperone GrpE